MDSLPGRLDVTTRLSDSIQKEITTSHTARLAIWKSIEDSRLSLALAVVLKQLASEESLVGEGFGKRSAG